jgi:TolB-like protein/Flp pilus assembly protein TadD
MSQVPPPLVPGLPEALGEIRLDSWKEIAAYLKREVRTAQRWEKNEGLPVHRLHHEKLGSVYAYKSELDAWWRDRRPVLEKEVDESGESVPDVARQAAGRPEDAAHNVDRALEPSPAPTPVPQPGTRVAPSRTLTAILVLFLLLGSAYVIKRILRPAPVSSSRIRLVVLPFRNLSGDPLQEAFCLGLTDAMTTQMGRLEPERLGIIASTTAAIIKDKPIAEIGKQLAVNYVLEGNALLAGSQVRVDARLIQVSDGTELWADTYSRDARDILAVQNEVAQAIAGNIRLTLSPAEKARLASGTKVDPDAYEAYLQGLAALNKRTPDGLGKSVQYFTEAIQRSPNYAPAYAGLADAYSILSAVPTAAVIPLDAMPKAKKDAQDAIRLDPSSAEAHASMGLVLQSYDWDLNGAEQEYQRAFAINPSYGAARHWHALVLMARGQHQAALDAIEQARTLDPLSPVIPSSRIQAFYFHREYDRAIEESHRALEVEPNFLLVHYHLGQALVQKKQYPEAIEEFQKAEAIAGPSDVFTMALGHAYAVSGNRAAAMKCLADLKAASAKRYVPALYFSSIYTGLGDVDQAIAWLKKACDEKTEYLIYMNVEPIADPLRSDPRFQAILHKIGLR